MQEHTMKIGDTVKLTAKAIRGINSKASRGKGINWIARRGIIVRVRNTTDQVAIQWPERTSIDYWPTIAVEKVG